MSAPTDLPPSGEPEDPAQQLAFLRTEAGIEIGLLHERVNALLAAEAFLTIAYTAAMSNGTAWGETFAVVVAPILAVLGLMLALLAWPGLASTAPSGWSWTGPLASSSCSTSTRCSSSACGGWPRVVVAADGPIPICLGWCGPR